MPYKHGGKISFISKHTCKLDSLIVQHELPSEAPFAPFHRKCFYNFTRWTIASRWNPKCKVYFRSNFALFKERRRQLHSTKYNRIIHPLSRLAMIRQMIMSLLWVLAFIIDPFFSAFYNDYTKTQENKSFHTVQMIMNFFFLIDLVLQFFIGFTEECTNEIVLDHGNIIRNYINTYFTFDLIAVVNGIFLYIINIETFKVALHMPHGIHTWASMLQLYAFRFVRIYTMCIYFSNTLMFVGIKESIVKCAIIALVVLIVIHWLTCILYLIPAITIFAGHPFGHSYILATSFGDRRTIDSLYIECLLNTVCHFFGAGRGNIKARNPFERIILAVILLGGFTCHIYVVAIVLQLFGTINVSETKYEELIYQLSEYMVTKKLPQVLRKRLLMYYEYRFQKQFFLEHLILNSLSEHLRYEVLLYSCKNLICKVKMFQGAPKEVIGAMVAMLKHEIFLPNDHIIKPDALNEHVYFISFGTVAVYLPNGKEAFHLEDGHHFGEVQVVLQDYRHILASVMAVEITEVFYLDKKDFWHVVKAHPEIADSLEKSALAKMSIYSRLMSESGEDLIDTSDILMQLRKGKILSNGRRRI